MKNYFIIAFFMSMSAISQAQKQVVLDLTDGVTWKGVFDSGFRPKHLSGGQYMCTEYDVAVSIQNSKTGFKVDLGVGNIDFKLKENHQLFQILFYGSEKRSLDEARIKSDVFARMFGENVTQRASLKTFQNKHEVDYAGNKINPPEIEEHVDLKTSTNAAKIGDFSIIYSFSDSYNDSHPLLEHLSVTLQSQEAKWAKRLTEKIKPPAGYEHVSLEPPPFVASGDENKPKLESNSEKNASKSTAERKITGEVIEDKKTGSLSWLYWILGALILGGVGVLVWNSLKGSSAQ